MKVLSNLELNNVNGGAKTWPWSTESLLYTTVGAVSYVAGLATTGILWAIAATCNQSKQSPINLYKTV